MYVNKETMLFRQPMRKGTFVIRFPTIAEIDSTLGEFKLFTSRTAKGNLRNSTTQKDGNNDSEMKVGEFPRIEESRVKM